VDLTLPAVINRCGTCQTVVEACTSGIRIKDVCPMGTDVVLLDATAEEHLRNILNARAIAAVEALKPKRPPYGTCLWRDQVLDGEYYSHTNSSPVWRAGGFPPRGMPADALAAQGRSGSAAWTLKAELVVLRSPEDFK